MKKQDFEKWLRYTLYAIPTEELERILQYYSDAIADRMEDGMTEEEAVAALGTREEILAACRMGLPTQTAVKRSRKKVWGFLAAAAVLLSLCAVVLPKLFPAPVQSPLVTPPETAANDEISWDGLHVEIKSPAASTISDPKNQMTLNFATDCLHALSIWEDVGNITVEPSSDDEIHVFFPDITQYDRMTTYDGILKIARVNNRPQ